MAQPPSPPTAGRSPPADKQRDSLTALMRSLVRPTFRKAFLVDPLGAMYRAKLSAESIPAEQLDVLAALSDAELEMFASVISKLRAANHDRGVSL